MGFGLSEVSRAEWPEGTEVLLEIMGQGARVVRKPDGSIAVFSALEFLEDGS